MANFLARILAFTETPQSLGITTTAPETRMSVKRGIRRGNYDVA